MSSKPLSEFAPETQLIHKGFDPKLSVGSVEVPIYPNSTYIFPDTKAGERAFELAFFPEKARPGEVGALIYSRANHPNAQILEERLIYAEPGAGAAAVFCSGMSAITTTVLALLPTDKTIVFTHPVYGGSYAFFEQVLPQITQIPKETKAIAVETHDLVKTKQVLEQVGEQLGMLFLETPANPTLTMTDIAEVAKLAKSINPNCYVVIDNTFLGIFQQPFEISPDVDIVIYSATKFMGGHSQLVAGVTLVKRGLEALMQPLKSYRTVLGNIAYPFVCWELLTSLKTYPLRMKNQAERAEQVARFLATHPRISHIRYPTLLQPHEPDYAIYHKQCTGSGSLITFELKNADRAQAFKFLDLVSSSHIISLAVSLGSVETLIEHPASMTHCEMSETEQLAAGITNATIRLSIGLEHPNDLIQLLQYGLDHF